jgi:NAD+ synthase (glutamine-hydrolysing)
MKIFVAQLNPVVGAIESNGRLIRESYRAGSAAGAGIVVVPELAVSGYPPRDLLDSDRFVEANLRMKESLASMTGETALVFGCIGTSEGQTGKRLRNQAVVAREGGVIFEQTKTLLPTYDVFDELRYFEAAAEVAPLELFGRKLGVLICEDFWFEQQVAGRPLYARNPVESLARQGCELLLNISASPFNVGKRGTRYALFRDIARRYSVPVVYVNQVGGNDELLFDGSSIALNSEGESVYCADPFVEARSLVVLDGPRCEAVLDRSEEAEIGEALQLGLRDYLRKCGFRGDVVIGLSGGIDSAVTAALAVEALGAERVTGIAMPSPFSSESSVTDARQLAENLGIGFHLVEISSIYGEFRRSFDSLFGDTTFDLTDENVQARIRGNILMAWSNKRGAMVVSTGNKSELAVGYCTLYGDMAGGLALLGDVYKTTVYRLARWLNREREVIPESSITKPPSAELRPDQTDQDSLPPYEVLDAILRLYIEEWRDIDAIVEAGFDRPLVSRILTMVDGNEFKRRQAAPAIRVSTKSFGSGRQMPIAQRWRSLGYEAASPEE